MLFLKKEPLPPLGLQIPKPSASSGEFLKRKKLRTTQKIQANNALFSLLRMLPKSSVDTILGVPTFGRFEKFGPAFRRFGHFSAPPKLPTLRIQAEKPTGQKLTVFIVHLDFFFMRHLRQAPAYGFYAHTLFFNAPKPRNDFVLRLLGPIVHLLLLRAPGWMKVGKSLLPHCSSLHFPEYLERMEFLVYFLLSPVTCRHQPR